MAVILYGIPACDSVKKGRVWLDKQGIAYSFHDYKKQGITAAKLAEWVAVAGWEKVLNRSGTTFKKLPDDMKSDLNADKAIAIMAEHTSAIKRPIVEGADSLLVGFNETDWVKAF